ncbi:hypothetical protein J8273_3700 [Carpediemonas membranifera]|uniref:Uncharacterized protein n=1 Tax=Carpediemonas membranifera TaxID=201153 RepID=A0A8J6B858_9EUKA|nr:hypothetical protein J8273_3700 [Carpediemonas membranifera]|eukprot:KAG9394727.1 hypothetical protein J8273_3700 [Carpediemonas membranifera]
MSSLQLFIREWLLDIIIHTEKRSAAVVDTVQLIPGLGDRNAAKHTALMRKMRRFMEMIRRVQALVSNYDDLDFSQIESLTSSPQALPSPTNTPPLFRPPPPKEEPASELPTDMLTSLQAQLAALQSQLGAQPANTTPQPAPAPVTAPAPPPPAASAPPPPPPPPPMAPMASAPKAPPAPKPKPNPQKENQNQQSRGGSVQSTAPRSFLDEIRMGKGKGGLKPVAGLLRSPGGTPATSKKSAGGSEGIAKSLNEQLEARRRLIECKSP